MIAGVILIFDLMLIIIGGIILIIYYKKTLTVIDKTDPEQTQFVCDLKQLQERIKNG